MRKTSDWRDATNARIAVGNEIGTTALGPASNRAMTAPFNTDARIVEPPLAQGHGCRCALHARRGFAALLGAGVLGIGGVPLVRAQTLEPMAECKRSGFTKVISAEQIEQSAGQQYRQVLQQASGKGAVAPSDHPQVVRLRAIAARIVPFTEGCNPRARDWRWEVNLIGSKQLNAFCMPGGKIAFYYGILAQLQLDDDEVAMIMGHEIGHALLEHARERVGKTTVTQVGASALSALLGLGALGDAVVRGSADLLTLKFSREDESEADALGLRLAARAGYNPRAGITLWQKMLSANKGAPPQWLSTHPSGATRINDIEARLPRIEPEYQRAAKPTQRFTPPKA